VLQHHVHPSVAKWAQIVLKGEHIKYQGDPIIDYSLAAFLDRFVYFFHFSILSFGYHLLA
jgi:hypothetical protein